MTRNFFALLLAIVSLSEIVAQDYELQSSTEIYQNLKKLDRGMRVLYVAAHPDDENTRLISWLENEQHIETAYLSLTRGQGGQNLIGDEKGDALGVIRTYELLEARKIDGGEQFFTRAVDFGYSKSATESFDKWGKDEVLHDVVYAIRKFRPHVIITRFPPDRNAGHGHHEASAILAEEAFDLAGDASAYTEQLKLVEPWQPQAMFFNTSSWWRKELDDKSTEELKAEKIHRINIGVYNPLTGMGINETAALARSKHRCQAFGTNRDRGERIEFLKQLRGDWNDKLFVEIEGIWKNSPEHQQAIEKLVEDFDFIDMAKNLEAFNQTIEPKLAQRNLWAEPQDIAYVNEMANNIKQNLMGVRIEVFAGKEPVVVGSEYEVTVQVYNAHDAEAMVRFTHSAIDTTVLVPSGVQIEWNEKLTAPTEPSTPYWLKNPHGNLYDVPFSENSSLARLKAEMISYSIRGKGRAVGQTELHRKWRDRSIGEVVQPMWYVPKVSVRNKKKHLLYIDERVDQELEVKAYESVDNLEIFTVSSKGEATTMVSLEQGEEQIFTSSWAAGLEDGKENVLYPVAKLGEEVFDQSVETITYEHIPNVAITSKCSLKISRIDLEYTGGKVLYIEGSGDEVDEALENIGYDVDRKDLSDAAASLSDYKTIVVGIRAFNKNDALVTYHAKLLEYVKNGGNLIVQYNTSYGLKLEEFGPYPFSIGRERVTEEDAVPILLEKKHALFNKPNELTSTDFDGWVQERGLYFASEWSDEYQPLISWKDSGEEKKSDGALLVAKYGKGAFIYTGISFFRQLPAGVPGAYRLFTNLIEYKP